MIAKFVFLKKRKVSIKKYNINNNENNKKNIPLFLEIHINRLNRPKPNIRC